MPQWGANSSNQSKPSWKHLTGQNGSTGNVANVFATSAGWVHRWPWGDEVLVAISDLATTLGGPVVEGLLVQSLHISNALATNVQVLLLLSEPVKVNGTPTLLAITNDAVAGETQNVTLSYVAGSSDPDAGKLVFANTTAGLLGNVNSVVNGVITGSGTKTLKINASSTFQGSKIVDKGMDDAGNLTPANVSTTFPAAYAQTIAIAAYMPGLGNTTTMTGLAAITRGTQPNAAAAQTVSFTLQFNEPLTVTGTPLALAIGASGAANVNVAYASASSNLANGTLVFSNTNVSLVGANDGTLTLNSTSTLVGWSGIVGVTSGNNTQNTLGFSANTLTITHL